jgi:transposase
MSSSCHRDDPPSPTIVGNGLSTRTDQSQGVRPKWLRQAEVDAGDIDGVTTMAARELRELKRKNAELERTIEILKAATSFFVRESDPQHR